MSSIVFNYLTRLAFFHPKGNLFNLELSEYHNTLINHHPKKESTLLAVPKVVNCSCCKWKGKVSESRKSEISFSGFTETELFCPRCNTYMGFVSGNR